MNHPSWVCIMQTWVQFKCKKNLQDSQTDRNLLFWDYVNTQPVLEINVHVKVLRDFSVFFTQTQSHMETKKKKKWEFLTCSSWCVPYELFRGTTDRWGSPNGSTTKKRKKEEHRLLLALFSGCSQSVNMCWGVRENSYVINTWLVKREFKG